MSITQISQQKYDLISVLATFGESVTFKPRHGPARTITAVLQRRGDYRPVGDALQKVRLVELTVLKDETDTTYGGIREVNLYDTATIDGTVYAFNGSVLRESTHGWELEFQSTEMNRRSSNTGEA